MKNTRPTVVAFLNNKGGVGKTTSAAYIGSSLARLGHPVHIIDFDPQGGIEAALGISLPEDTPRTEDLICRSAVKWPAVRATPLLPLYVTTSSPMLNTIEEMIQNTSDSDVAHRVGTKIPIGLDYTEIVIIDCPPAFGNMTRAAVMVSDYVIIPTNPVPADLRALIRTIDYVQLLAGKNEKPKIAGILFTRDEGYTINEDFKAAISSRLPGLPFSKSIRATVLMEETPIRGCLRPPLKRNRAAQDYIEVTREIYQRIMNKPLFDTE